MNKNKDFMGQDFEKGISIASSYSSSVRNTSDSTAVRLVYRLAMVAFIHLFKIRYGLTMQLLVGSKYPGCVVVTTWHCEQNGIVSTRLSQNKIKAFEFG